MQMPIEFQIFENFCTQHGYKAVDQRKDKIPSNIYAIRTRNGVKVEIKTTKKITSYVAGFGLSSEKLDLLKIELESQGMIILKYNPTFLYIQFKNDILDGFLTLVKYIEDIDAIAQRKAGARRLIESTGYDPFLAVSELIQLTIKTGRSEWMGRGNGTFDSIDNIITVGYSIKGRQQELNGKNAYREHIVPCTLIERKAIEMFKLGNTVEQVAEMIKSNLFILRISDEEAYKLDIELGLRTTMPEGWDFGHDVYSRITVAGIQLEVDK
jgi:hypothetical protein